MTKLIHAGIVGPTGFTGIELIKILKNHKNVVIKELLSESSYNKYFDELFPDLNISNLPKLKKKDDIHTDDLDVIFVALPHIESQKFISLIIDKVKIIDLSGDFRLKNFSDYEKWYSKFHSIKNRISEFTYGLCEIYKEKILESENISVPGCYPTSILLPLIPLLKNKFIKSENIIIDAKSGYSGAGRKFDLNKLFKDDFKNFYSYNTNNHRHIPEIEQELSEVQKNKVNIIFNPNILPAERGIISTIYCSLNNNYKPIDIEELLINFYKNHEFVEIVKTDQNITVFDVNGTNKCLIKVIRDTVNNIVIIESVIDNLIKGASGQAVQNMNIMFHLNENESLNLKKLVNND